MVRGGGKRILNAVSRSGKIWMVVYGVPIPAVPCLHGFFDLFDSSGSSPSVGVQDTS